MMEERSLKTLTWVQCDYALSDSVRVILDLLFKILTAIVMAEKKKNTTRFLM